MNRIFALARELGASQVRGRYLPTAKNAMVKDFYQQFGFARVAGADDGATEWLLALADYAPKPLFIRESAPADPSPLSEAL
jgi:predicted enzyme involved in methoxymalonyl-ACP biosynthesis